MTRDEVIRMAREADLVTWGFQSLEWEPVQNMEAIERFASVVVAAEREECAKLAAWILKMPQNDVSAAIRAMGNVNED